MGQVLAKGGLNKNAQLAKYKETRTIHYIMIKIPALPSLAPLNLVGIILILTLDLSISQTFPRGTFGPTFNQSIRTDQFST